MHTMIIDLSEIGPLTDKQLFRLCSSNSEVRFERTAKGELIAMSPSGAFSGFLNARFVSALDKWNAESQRGIVFDSSAGFSLRNRAMRAPDASWIKIETWEHLTEEQKDEFPPVCPDFVCEIMSPSDRLRSMQEKMEEWMANGCRLGWLIYPKNECAYIYRPNSEVEIISSFDAVLSGGDILLGFTFDLKRLRRI
jgi:Uma2 family endonuclease